MPAPWAPPAPGRRGSGTAHGKGGDGGVTKRPRGAPALRPPWSRARASCQDPSPNLASFSCTEVLARGFNIQVSLLRCPQLPGGSVPVTDAPARLLSSLLLAFSISHSPCKSCRRSISAIRQWQKCSRQEHGAPRPHAAASASPCRRGEGDGAAKGRGGALGRCLPLCCPCWCHHQILFCTHGAAVEGCAGLVFMRP